MAPLQCWHLLGYFVANRVYFCVHSQLSQWLVNFSAKWLRHMLASQLQTRNHDCGNHGDRVTECWKTHITLLSTAPALWTPGNLRAPWRSTAVAAAVRLFCVVRLSSWRRPCQMSCGHRGMERMVYCMAGTRLLGTQMRDMVHYYRSNFIVAHLTSKTQR